MATSRLESVVNLSLLATCLLVSAAAGKRLYVGGENRDLARPSEYSRGEVLPPLAGVRYADKERTVLLFLSSHCQFCSASMPFYAKLSAARHSGGLQLVVLGGEPELTLAQYIAGYHLEVDYVRTIRPGDLKVVATPTVILANRTGQVEGLWRGARRDREPEVEAALLRR